LNLGHVIRLDPTTKQANALARACGVARFTYNWALAEWNRQYKAGEKPSANALKKQFNQIKRGSFPWIVESPRDANSQPFADLGRAFSNFFSSLKGTRRGRKIRRPVFKKKGQHDSFYVANDRFSLHSRGKRGIVRLPVVGDVRTTEPLRWRGKILSGRITRRADRWYLSVAVDVPDANRCVMNSPKRRPAIGVDLGLKTTLALSDGTALNAPMPLKKSLRQLCRANRRLHRRKKGGRNCRKARIAVARLYQRIANVRKDFWDKITTRLVRENQTIVVEDLSMSFILKNRGLARTASDVALGMFRPMLLYKARLHESEIVVADKFFPSTQRCSGCGEIKNASERLTLKDRVFVCNHCGFVVDRDHNASLNLERYPRLEGNWRQVPSTPMDDRAATRRLRRASPVAEVGTNRYELESSCRESNP
jgi:putative transposase